MISIPAAYEIPDCQFAKSYPTTENRCQGKDLWGDAALETVAIAIHPRSKFRLYRVQQYHLTRNQTSEEAEVHRFLVSLPSFLKPLIMAWTLRDKITSLSRPAPSDQPIYLAHKFSV